MVEWQISNQDIESAERLLLPAGAHFAEDAKNVIRCWSSTDVSACPGSGKTTVLLAKLKLLADRMPLENGAGICVLSHTNVAVDEIKKHLSGYADRLISYPNYVGTIQSFVDRFITMPYLRDISGQNVQVVDSFTYAHYVLNKMQTKYKTLDYVTRNNFERGHQYENRVKHTQALYIREDGALCLGNQKKALAGADKHSTIQYKQLCLELLKNEGIITYQDAYSYAKAAIDELTESYTELFSKRFQYVFIDEYQDCNDTQRQAIDAIFDSTKCSVFRIGDPDQAIYNSSEETTLDWAPQYGFLPISTSCRYSQEIANVICKLKKSDKSIETLYGETGVKPVLLVFSPEKIDCVIDGFITALDNHNIYDVNGVYKAVGAIKKEDSSGLKIGSYWAEFDGSIKKNEYNYWFFVDEIIGALSVGKLYKAEQNIRKLLCRVFHYIGIKNPLSEKEYTTVTVRKTLDEKYREPYRQWILDMSCLQSIDRESVNHMLRQKVNELLRIYSPDVTDFFIRLPEHFLNESTIVNHNDSSGNNVWIEPIRGRKIVFDTIHAVKGETHDATLYLETDRQGASDLYRILPCLGVGKKGALSLYDYSRKLAYVGMSRPKKLLCVAMQSKTYEKAKGIFDCGWEVMDLRG